MSFIILDGVVVCVRLFLIKKEFGEVGYLVVCFGESLVVVNNLFCFFDVLGDVFYFLVVNMLFG